MTELGRCRCSQMLTFWPTCWPQVASRSPPKLTPKGTQKQKGVSSSKVNGKGQATSQFPFGSSSMQLWWCFWSVTLKQRSSPHPNKAKGDFFTLKHFPFNIFVVLRCFILKLHKYCILSHSINALPTYF